MNLTVLSLCAGIGGIDLGLRLACGTRTVCYVEREAFACAVLVTRMEAGDLDIAPVWFDLCTFDSQAWAGAVDIIAAGFPCQPFSVAGPRRGIEDARWIWPDIVRIIRAVEPRFVFLENVPPLVKHGLGIVLADLHSLGFDAEWDVFSAAQVGAPHQRERLFILARAISDGDRKRVREPTEREVCEQAEWEDTESVGVRATLDDTSRDGWGERWPKQSGQYWQHAPSEPVFPPRSDCPPECWPAGVPQPCVCGSVNGLPTRVDRLRACGNAVVPAQAALAWQALMERFT